ncbi:MAG: hypothetical protein AAFR02_12195 [Pseudomonadota bacterium]
MLFRKAGDGLVLLGLAAKALDLCMTRMVASGLSLGAVHCVQRTVIQFV